jgi:hypothetical protein
MSIDHNSLDEQLHAWLGDVTNLSIGLMEAERTLIDGGETKIFGYIEPLDGTLYSDAEYGSVYTQAEVPYAFHSFGPDKKSARVMASLLHTCFVNHVQYPMALTGFSVLRRRPDGGPDKPTEVARGLFSVREPFVIEICAQ